VLQNFPNLDFAVWAVCLYKPTNFIISIISVACPARKSHDHIVAPKSHDHIVVSKSHDRAHLIAASERSLIEIWERRKSLIQVLQHYQTAQPDGRRWRQWRSANLYFLQWQWNTAIILSCHLTCRICLWQRIWKASRRLIFETKRVCDSERYKRTGTLHVMYTQSFVR